MAYNEARENSKFLQAVEKHCAPLYRGNIVSDLLTIFGKIHLIFLPAVFGIKITWLLNLDSRPLTT